MTSPRSIFQQALRSFPRDEMELARLRVSLRECAVVIEHRLQQDLGASGALFFRGVLRLVVADAIPAGNENHRRGRDARNICCIVAGAGNNFPRCKPAERGGTANGGDTIWVEADRVYLLDRENNRIQIFSLDGDFIDMWTQLERPTDMYVDSDRVAYISELEDHVSIRDLDGNVIGRFGSERSNAPGKFWGPHSVWVDSVGDLYVGEVLEGQRLQKFARKK